MNFVQWHLGDWSSGTALMSATERGVYMDLLVHYYLQEKPLMRSQCERIARAYANNEREAMRYVLSEFFEEDGDSYRNRRADREIEAFHAKSNKARESAKARWSKKAKELSSTEDSMRSHTDSICDQDANAMRTHDSSNANAMLTNNHKYLNKTPFSPPSKKIEQPTLIDCEESKEERKRVSVPESLPDDWRDDALKARPDVDPEFVFKKYRARYAPTTNKKTMKGWRGDFMKWVGREFASVNGAGARSVYKPSVFDDRTAEDFSNIYG